MRLTLIVLATVILAAISYIAASPYITLHQIRTAVVERDMEAVNESVDFPQLRINLKEQIKSHMIDSVSPEMNIFEALTVGLVTNLIEPLVELYITPASLAKLMAGKIPERDMDGSSGDPRPVSEETLLDNARYTYDSFSKFSAWVPVESGEELRFVLSRHGLSWKLTNIVIPWEK